jgi:hypothetical protein
LLVLKFDRHKSDRLGVILFTNSVTKSVQILYRFQRLNCLLKLILQSVHGHYNKVVDACLMLLVVGVSDLGVRKPTSKFVVECPCPDGLARDGTQGENVACIISHQGGVLVVGVTSVRERERESEPVRLLVPPRDPLAGRPWTSLL